MEGLFALAFWGVIFWICWKLFLGKLVNNSKAQIAARQISDEDYYEMAAEEVQSDQIRPGLWAKAWSDAGGDDIKAKALYLKLRVAVMKDEAAKNIMAGMTYDAAIQNVVLKTLVQCPSCNQTLRLDFGKEGRVTCPACGSNFSQKT